MGYLLYGGCVLGDQALAAMTDFKDSYYGLGAQDHESRIGFGVTPLACRHSAWLHRPATGVPEEGLAVAVLRNTNGNDAEMTSIVGQLRAASAP